MVHFGFPGRFWYIIFIDMLKVLEKGIFGVQANAHHKFDMSVLLKMNKKCNVLMSNINFEPQALFYENKSRHHRDYEFGKKNTQIPMENKL